MFENPYSIFATDDEISRRIAEIDEIINRQLNEILHHPEFKALEAAWRGLYYLVNQGKLGLRVKVLMLNANKKDLLKDFERSERIEDAGIFKKCYLNVYQEGREYPFGLLIGDYEFGQNPQDVALLEYLAEVSAHAHAPFIAGASPSIFESESFDEMAEKPQISEIFESTSKQRWNDFRKSPQSRFVGLCLPHILLRESHRTAKTFNFRETLEKQDLLWGNAAFAFAGCVVRAHSEKNWLGRIRGIGTDGETEGLVFRYAAQNNNSNIIESALDAGLKNKFQELMRLGFMPLFEDSGSNPYFYLCPSVHQPPLYDTELANETTRRHLQIENVLAASRFAVNLMHSWFDNALRFNGLKEKNIYLQKWLNQFYLVPNGEPDEIRAQHPLRECYLTLAEDAEKPGYTKGVLYIYPHYLLDDLKIAMRLIIYFVKPFYLN